MVGGYPCIKILPWDILLAQDRMGRFCFGLAMIRGLVNIIMIFVTLAGKLPSSNMRNRVIQEPMGSEGAKTILVHTRGRSAKLLPKVLLRGVLVIEHFLR